jgi:hypothetical protein
MTADAITVVTLSAWLGAAILVAAVVAPAAFAVLPSRTLAGALVGRVLPVLFYGGALVGLVVALLARGPMPTAARVVGGVVMAATCLAAQLLVAPNIERIRVDVARPIDELAPGDPRRAAFGRLHGVSVLLLGAAALAGGAALVLTLRTMSHASTKHDLSNTSLEH